MKEVDRPNDEEGMKNGRDQTMIDTLESGELVTESNEKRMLNFGTSMNSNNAEELNESTSNSPRKIMETMSEDEGSG